jgi:hypothetical protein
MNRRIISLSIVLAMLSGFALVPTSSAQDAPQIVSVADDRDDVTYESQGPLGADGDSGNARASIVDLIQVEVGPDTQSTLPMRLSYIDPSDGAPSNPEEERWERITFNADGAKYFLQSNDDPCEKYAFYQVLDSTGQDRIVDCVENHYDPSTNTVEFILEKSNILRETGAPIAAGDKLTGIRALSWTGSSPDGDPAPGADNGDAYTLYYDYAPDVDGFEFTSNIGGASSDNPGFSVAALAPIRSTNGAEATFRFELILTENQGVAHNLAVSVSETWDNTEVFANRTLDLNPNQVKSEPVYLSLPFGHKHGETKWFTVRFTDQETSEWSEIDLAIHWLTVPQPAGHHPQLFLHSFIPEPHNVMEDGTSQAYRAGGILGNVDPIWINAVDIDPSPSATDEPVTGNSGTGLAADGQKGFNRWVIPLAPELIMGMQFNPGEPAPFTTGFEGLTDGATQTIEAHLMLCKYDLNVEPSEMFGQPVCQGTYDIIASYSDGMGFNSQGGSFDATIELAVDPEYATIPFQLKQNLILALELTENPGVLKSGDIKVRMKVAGSSIVLPLEEYTEPSPLNGDPLNFQEQETVEQIPMEGEVPEPVQESPIGPWISLVSLLGAALILRRTRN